MPLKPQMTRGAAAIAKDTGLTSARVGQLLKQGLTPTQIRERGRERAPKRTADKLPAVEADRPYVPPKRRAVTLVTKAQLETETEEEREARHSRLVTPATAPPGYHKRILGVDVQLESSGMSPAPTTTRRSAWRRRG